MQSENRDKTLFNGPIFLVGMPRSGTKLLRDLLNQHPKVAIPSIETEFLPGLLRKHTALKLFNRKEFADLYRKLTKFPYFSYLYENGNQLGEEEWYSSCVTSDLPGLFEALIRCSTETKGREDILWGDKSPSYIGHTNLLKAAFPSARFIHIVRDVRDYAISISAAWGKNRLRATQRWADALDAIEVDTAPISNDVLVIRYEDLLEDPKSTMRRVLDFLDLEFDDRVLQLTKTSENLGDTKGELTIVFSNKNKYTSKLSAAEIKELEKLAGDTLRRYGYTTIYRGPRQRLTKMIETFYQLQDAVNMVKFESKNRGYLGSVKFYWRYFRATRGL